MKRGFVRIVCLAVLGIASNSSAMWRWQGTGGSEEAAVIEGKMAGLNLAQLRYAFFRIDEILCVSGKKLYISSSASGGQAQDGVDKAVWDIWLKHESASSHDCLDAMAKRYLECRSTWANDMKGAIEGGSCADAARLLSAACWSRVICLAREANSGDARKRYVANQTYENVILPLRSRDKTALQKCELELEKWEAKTKMVAEAWRSNLVGDPREYSDTYDEYLEYLSSEELLGLSEDEKKSALQNFVMDDEWGSVTAAVVKKYRDRAQCASQAGQLISGSPVFDEDTRVLARSRLMGMAEKNELADNLDRATNLRVLAQQVCSIVDESDARQLREQVLQEFAEDFTAFSDRAAVWQLSTSPVAANTPGASDHQNYGAEGAGVGELIQSGC